MASRMWAKLGHGVVSDFLLMTILTSKLFLWPSLKKNSLNDFRAPKKEEKLKGKWFMFAIKSKV